jgi:hypothetical protein
VTRPSRLQAGSLLSEQEIERLLSWLAHQRGGFDEREAATVVGWARDVRREQLRLERVLDGDTERLEDVLPPASGRRGLLRRVR